MKHALLLLTAVVLLFGLTVEQGDAQTMRRIVDLMNFNFVTNGETDTLSLVSLEYQGMWPDSVKASWRAVGGGDSVKVYVACKVRQGSSSSGPFTYSLTDSVTTREADYFSIPSSTYMGKDEMSLSFKGRATGNAAVEANGARLYLRLEMFYHR